MKFENALTASARVGKKVETEVIARVIEGTDVAMSIQYKAWINDELVLDVFIDPNMQPLESSHKWWCSMTPDQLVKKHSKSEKQ